MYKNRLNYKKTPFVVMFIAIIILFIVINTNLLKTSNNSQTVINVNDIIDIDSATKIKQSSEGTKIYSDDKVYELLSVPLFSVDDNSIQTLSESELLVFGSDIPYSVNINIGSTIKKIDDIINVSNKNTFSIKSVSLNFSNDDELFKDSILYFDDRNYFMFYDSTLQIDGKSYDIPDMSYYKILDDKLYVYYMEEQQLQILNYDYQDEYVINYGELRLTDDNLGINDLDLIKNDDLNFEPSTIEANNSIVDSSNEIINSSTTPLSNYNPIQNPEANAPNVDNVQGSDDGLDVKYTMPKIKNIEIVSKDIIPFENIQLLVEIDNPDYFDLMNLVTSEGSLLINSNNTGSFYLDLAPKTAGTYAINFESLIVKKDKVYVIPINETLEYTVLDIPYIIDATFGNLDKGVDKADVLMEFSSNIDGFKLSNVVIEGQEYNDVKQISDNKILVKDVKINTQNVGEVSQKIDSYVLKDNTKSYMFKPDLYNDIDGYILKDEYDKSSIELSKEWLNKKIEYHVSVADFDNSITKIRVNIIDKSSDLIIETSTSYNDYINSYDFLFNNVTPGMEYYFSVSIFSNRGDGNEQEYQILDEDTISIPFIQPTVQKMYMNEFVINEKYTSLYLELDNPDNYELTSITINDIVYENISESDDELYVVDNIPFSNILEYNLEEFTIQTLSFVTPLGDKFDVDMNEQILQSYFIMEPEFYTNVNNEVVIEWKFPDTIDNYQLQVNVLSDSIDIVDQFDLKEGNNIFMIDPVYLKDEILTIKCDLIHNGENEKIYLDNDQLLLTNKMSKVAINSINTIYIDEDNNLNVSGENSLISQEVPNIKADKVIMQEKTAIAFDSNTKSAFAWGTNNEVINEELEVYNGNIIDIYLSPTQEVGNYLVGIVLDNGDYKIFGTDQYKRISLMPKNVKAQVSNLVLSDYNISIIDEKGYMYVGDTTDHNSKITIETIPLQYTNQSEKILSFSMTRYEFAILDRFNRGTYYFSSSESPVYTTSGEYRQLKVYSCDDESYLTFINDDNIQVLSNPDSSPPIINIPDFIQAFSNDIVSIDVPATGENGIVYYNDGTYNIYGQSDNEQMLGNTINHIPEIENMSLKYVNADDPVPGQSGLFTADIINNKDGLYIDSISFRNSSGEIQGFKVQKANNFDQVDMYNVYLNANIGNNEYEVAQIVYESRYNSKDKITKNYDNNAPSFNVYYVTGVNVLQDVNNQIQVSYGVINPEEDLDIYMKYYNEEWKYIDTIRPSKAINYKIDNVDSESYIKIKVENSTESYESDYMVTVDNAQSSYSLNSSVTTKLKSGKLKTQGSEDYYSQVKFPKNEDNYVKIDSYGKVNFALGDDYTLDVSGERYNVNKYKSAIKDYQYSIVDFQIVGSTYGQNLPVVNLYLKDGTSKLIVPDVKDINWDVDSLKNENIVYITGDNNIAYYIKKDGTFGIEQSSSAQGQHTIDKIPSTITNGTTKITDVEYTLQATYIQDVAGNVITVQRDSEIDEDLYIPLDKQVKQLDSTTGYINGKQYSNVYFRYLDESSSQAEVYDGLINVDNYANNEQVVKLNQETEVTTGMKSVMYTNDYDYYFVSNYKDGRMEINYNPVKMQFNPSAGVDSVSIHHNAQFENSNMKYKILDVNTGKEISEKYETNDDNHIVIGLDADTLYSYNIQATYYDYEGNEYQKIINDEPITFKTELTNDKYLKPQIINEEYDEGDNYLLVQLEVYNPSYEELIFKSSFDENVYKLLNVEDEGEIVSKYIFEVDVNKLSDDNDEIYFEVNSQYDPTMPEEYYTNDIYNFYSTVINSKNINGNSYYLNDNKGTFIYQSPLNNKYYTIGELNGEDNAFGSETIFKDNYIFDENGNYNLEFSFDNGANKFNSQCSTLNFKDEMVYSNINMNSTCSAINDDFKNNMGFTSQALVVRNVEDDVHFQFNNLIDLGAGHFVWDISFIDESTGKEYDGEKDFIFNLADGKNTLTVETPIDNVKSFATSIYYSPDVEWKMYADRTNSYYFQADDYIEIKTCEQLDAIPDNDDTNYILANNINCSHINSYTGAKNYNGNFNGDGYGITNFRSSYSGLFETLGSNAHVENLYVSGNIYNMVKSYSDVGILANYSYSGAQVSNVIVSGEVNSRYNGDLTGVVGGTNSDVIIKNVYSDVNIHSDVDLDASTSWGSGITFGNALVADSIYAGDIKVTNKGGHTHAIGSSSVSFYNDYVSEYSDIYKVTDSTLPPTASSEQLRSEDFYESTLGWNSGEKNKYAPWDFSYLNTGLKPILYNGMSVGDNTKVINDSSNKTLTFIVSDLNIPNVSIESVDIVDNYNGEDTIITTLTPDQVHYVYEYDETYYGGIHNYYLKVNTKDESWYTTMYPVDIETGAVAISTCEQLDDIPNNSYRNYKLQNDIDCSDINYSGAIDFHGVFDGNGYSVYNLNSNNTGLFESLSDHAIVKNVIIKGNIIGFNNSNTGLVASRVEGDDVLIENVGTEGMISTAKGGNNIAGLIGIVESENLTINNCYSTVDFNTEQSTNNNIQISGLVNSSGPEVTIKNSFYAGSRIILPKNSTNQVSRIYNLDNDTFNSYYSTSTEIINGSFKDTSELINAIDDSKFASASFYEEELRWDTINIWNINGITNVNMPILSNMIDNTITLDADNTDDLPINISFRQSNPTQGVEEINIYEVTPNSINLNNKMLGNATNYNYSTNSEYPEVYVEYVLENGQKLLSNQIMIEYNSTDSIPITSCQQLVNIPDNSSQDYHLENNINCEYIDRYIGPLKYSGTFDGKGHSIVNLKSDVSGVFEILSPGAEVYNLSIDGDINYKGNSGKYLGLLSHSIENDVSVKNVKVTGSIIAQNQAYIGGLSNNSKGDFENIYSDVDIFVEQPYPNGSYGAGVSRGGQIKNSIYNGTMDVNTYASKSFAIGDNDKNSNNYQTYNTLIQNNGDEKTPIASKADLSSQNWYSDILLWDNDKIDGVWNTQFVSDINPPTLSYELRLDSPIEAEYDSTSQIVELQWGNEISLSDYDNINIYVLDEYGEKVLLGNVGPHTFNFKYSVMDLPDVPNVTFILEYTNDDQFIGQVDYEYSNPNNVYIPINTCNDLMSIPMSSKLKYKLSNDIDCTNQEFKSIANFQGELNGFGYEIYGLNKALFRSDENAKISNIKINGTIKNGDAAIVSNESTNSVYENIILSGMIDYADDSIRSLGSLISLSYGTTIKNVYSDVDFKTTYDVPVSGFVGSGDAEQETKVENALFAGNIFGPNSETYPIGKNIKEKNTYYYELSQGITNTLSTNKATVKNIENESFYSDFLKWDTEKIFNVNNVSDVNPPTLLNAPRIIKDLSVIINDYNVEMDFFKSLYVPYGLDIEDIEIHQVTDGEDVIIDSISPLHNSYSYPLDKPYSPQYNFYVLYNMTNNRAIKSNVVTLEVEPTAEIEISTCGQIDAIEDNSYDNYILVNNINCSGIDYTGAKNYGGTFNGNGYKIENLNSDNGLFESTKNAVIKNLSIFGNINYNDDYYGTSIGMLIGEVNGPTDIINVSTHGDIILSGENYMFTNIGGIIGDTENGSDVKITESYSTVNMDVLNFSSSDLFIGGLVGYGSPDTQISNSYYAGESIKSKDTEKNIFTIGYNCMLENVYYSSYHLLPFTNIQGLEITDVQLGDPTWYENELLFKIGGFNEQKPWNATNVSVDNQPTLWNVPRSTKAEKKTKKPKTRVSYSDQTLELLLEGEEGFDYNIYLNKGYKNSEIDNDKLITEVRNGETTEFIKFMENNSDDYTFVITNPQTGDIVDQINVPGTEKHGFIYNIKAITSSLEKHLNDMQFNFKIAYDYEHLTLNESDIYQYENRMISKLPGSVSTDDLLKQNNIYQQDYLIYKEQVQDIYQQKENGEIDTEQAFNKINSITNNDIEENEYNYNDTHISNTITKKIPSVTEDNYSINIVNYLVVTLLGFGCIALLFKK